MKRKYGPPPPATAVVFGGRDSLLEHDPSPVYSSGEEPRNCSGGNVYAVSLELNETTTVLSKEGVPGLQITGEGDPVTLLVETIVRVDPALLKACGVVLTHLPDLRTKITAPREKVVLTCGNCGLYLTPPLK
jgi:hypothetical protein